MANKRPTGIVVHSTGANNPTLKRYVQPLSSDTNYSTIMADLGQNAYGNHWNRYTPDGRSVCVHAFIGKNATGKVETYQTLPFDTVCWGVGSGRNGSYNYDPVARVQFEICEDGLTDTTYFNAAMKEAQELCAYLCRLYGLPVSKISSHQESYQDGYGSNHGDPHNWLSKHGKTMDWFREEVQKLLSRSSATSFKVGDLVGIKAGATYYTGKSIPAWVMNQKWYIRSISGDRAVIDRNEAGTNSICSPVNVKYLI